MLVDIVGILQGIGNEYRLPFPDHPSDNGRTQLQRRVDVGQALERMTGGDQVMLEIEGFGRKSLADLKRALKRRGFELPEAALEPQV